ncbi:Serine racemase [Ralstonia solanacearum UW551]|nr:Serine racemase [Ralstonia solanacearum UW551]
MTRTSTRHGIRACRVNAAAPQALTCEGARAHLVDGLVTIDRSPLFKPCRTGLSCMLLTKCHLLTYRPSHGHHRRKPPAAARRQEDRRGAWQDAGAAGGGCAARSQAARARCGRHRQQPIGSAGGRCRDRTGPGAHDRSRLSRSRPELRQPVPRWAAGQEHVDRPEEQPRRIRGRDLPEHGRVPAERRDGRSGAVDADRRGCSAGARIPGAARGGGRARGAGALCRRPQHHAHGHDSRTAPRSHARTVRRRPAESAPRAVRSRADPGRGALHRLHLPSRPDHDMTTLPITYDDVVAAHARLQGQAHRTPVLTSTTANALTGAELFFKCENFQRMGAFKFRGAYNALSQFTPEQRKAGVITFSSGNHAQAIALSARLLGMRAVIVMPKDAPAIKVEATRGYGGEVVFYDRYTEDREAIGRRLAEQHGLTLIPPYDHPHVMAGQGTAAKELIEETGPLDLLLVCLGGGGLLSGCATAARALSPACRIIGVEPEAGNDGQQSLRKGEIVHIDTPATIADGAQTQHLGHYTFAVIRELVDEIATVSDADLVDTMRFFAGRMKIVVEPTGCLAAAAALQQRVDVRGKRVGVIVSGGNVDLQHFARLVQAAA